VSESPFFSVVIPLYNKAPHVARSISSVLRQTCQDFELIIIDDASTDGSVAEVQKLNDPRIRLLYRNEPGPGGYAARNLGIKESRGEWIAFLDADDEWYPEHLERMHRLSMEENAGLVAEGWVDSFGNGVQKPIRFLTDKKCKNSLMRISFDRYLYEVVNKKNFLHTNIVTVKKNILEEIGGFPAGKCTRGGDTALWLLLMHRCRYVVYSITYGSIYCRENSYVTQKNAPLIEDDYVYKMSKSILMKSDSAELSKKIKKYSNFFIYNAIKFRARNGNFDKKHMKYLYSDVDIFKYIFLCLILLVNQKKQKKIFRLYDALKYCIKKLQGIICAA